MELTKNKENEINSLKEENEILKLKNKRLEIILYQLNEKMRTE